MRDFVRQLTVQGSLRDDPGFRLRMASLLGTVEWHLNPLPPTAILLVRRFQSRLPAGVEDRPLSTGRSWAKATNLYLNELSNRAVTPVEGIVPPGAQVLLFRDSVEALACLSMAWQRGIGFDAWWGRSLIHYWQLSNHDLPYLWRHKARYVPAVLDQLSDWGQAATVVGAIEDLEAIEILKAVAYEHDLGSLAALFDPNSGLPQESESSSRITRPSPLSIVPRPALMWPGNTLRTSQLRLSKAQTALLMSALIILRRPRELRRQTTLQAIQTWWVAGDFSQQAPDNVVEALPIEISCPSREFEKVKASLPVLDALELGTWSSKGNQPDQDLSGRSTPPDFQSENSGEQAAPSPSEAVEPVVDANPSFKATGQSELSSQPSFHDPPRSRPEASEENRGTSPGVVTQLGGVFYLINLMRQLDLPNCFEPVCFLTSTVGPWGTLEGLARAMLVRIGDEYAADPLWQALAQLDGREPDIPLGEAFACPSSFEWPDGWPEHPGLATPPSPAYRSGLQPGNLLDKVAPDFRRWLQTISPKVAAQLEAVIAPLKVPEVLATPAHLYLTCTHLDVFMAIESVHLPLRLAGLDFDPGWLPRWGRVVLFHYE